MCVKCASRGSPIKYAYLLTMDVQSSCISRSHCCSLFNSSLLLASRVDMHHSSRIRFIFAIVAAIGIKIVNWEMTWVMCGALQKQSQQQRQKRNLKRNGVFLVFGCRWSRIDDIKFTSWVYGACIGSHDRAQRGKRLSISFHCMFRLFIFFIFHSLPKQLSSSHDNGNNHSKNQASHWALTCTMYLPTRWLLVSRPASDITNEFIHLLCWWQNAANCNATKCYQTKITD